MELDVNVVIGEDDEGHALLIKRNLQRSGISNPILHFSNGKLILDFFDEQISSGEIHKKGYILLLDIQMPNIGGIEVLETLKQHEILKKIPVIMITTTDNPQEIETCHQLGCNSYIVKPIDYEKFIDVIKRLGFFLKIVQVPKLA
ncbi:MAG: response regulator [Bacteroidetes bacterium]|nr:response regulator [Bacteroidota bacterium]